MAVTMTLVSESGDTHTLQNDLRICLVSTFCQALLSLKKKKNLRRYEHYILSFCSRVQIFKTKPCFSLLHLHIPVTVDTLSLAPANDKYGKLVNL